MLSLTFDSESNLVCSTSGKAGFIFAPSTVNGAFKHAYHVVKYLLSRIFLFTCVCVCFSFFKVRIASLEDILLP